MTARDGWGTSWDGSRSRDGSGWGTSWEDSWSWAASSETWHWEHVGRGGVQQPAADEQTAAANSAVKQLAVECLSCAGVTVAGEAASLEPPPQEWSAGAGSLGRTSESSTPFTFPAVPAFVATARGLPQDWNKACDWAAWGKRSWRMLQPRRAETPTTGAERIGRMLRFLEVREAGGRCARSKVGEPTAHDGQWWRLPWRQSEEEVTD